MENRKEFYERIIVAKVIQKIYEGRRKQPSLNECFNYVKKAEDVDSPDFSWFKICGDNVTWGDHLLFVCSEVLGVRIPAPCYDPFSVDEKTFTMSNSKKIVNDPEYYNWFINEWTPFVKGLLEKYKSLYSPKLEAKAERGDVPVLKIIQESYFDESEMKESNSFSK